MTTNANRETGQTSSRGDTLVSDEERALLIQAVTLARRRPADEAEIETVLEWVRMTRINFLMLEGVLRGYLFIQIDDDLPPRFERAPDVPLA